MAVPPNVTHALAEILRSQDCPVYDAERDVTKMNVALCTRGEARVPRRPSAPKPATYSSGEAQAMVQCSHFSRDAQKTLKDVRRTGKRKKLLNGDDVRKIVYEAHGNNSASWLTCAIGSLSLPEWFASLWLPMRDAITKEKRELISRVWKALHAVAEPSSPVPSEDVIEFVRRCRDQHIKGNYRTEAADLPSTCITKRRDVVLSNINGNVLDALITLGYDAFPCGAARRSIYMCDYQWVPSALLTSCVDFVTTGHEDNSMGEDLFERLLATQAEAAVEMAVAHGIPHDEDEDPDVLFEIIDMTLRRRSVAGSFEALGMEVIFHQGEDVIEVVTDAVSRVSSSDIGLTDGIELWTPWHGKRSARHIATLCPEEMRECFDRHVGLIHALECRGLKMREDSRVCSEYVMDGTYGGPSFEFCECPCEDEVQCVVELMAEMEFLFGTTGTKHFANFTSQIRFAGYDGDDASELAKLAYVHWHVVVEGRSASVLPMRLRAIHDGRHTHTMTSAADAWQEVLDAKQDMRDYDERRYERWAECSSDDDY
jgi:hypothetical protein